MNKKYIQTISVILILLSLYSCDKNTDSIHSISLNSASSISETGFTAHWETISSDIQSLTLEIATDEEFSNIVKSSIINDLKLDHQTIDGLQGARKYYFRLNAKLPTGEGIISNIKTVKTTYFSQVVTYQTEDGLTISGKLSYLSYNESPAPAVIFMHEMGIFVNNWNNSEVVDGLIAKGYVCLVFDFRGHGNSSDIDDLSILLSDKSLIAKDLKDSIEYLKTNERVNSQKIDLVGASLGAIMAVAGNGFEEVKTSVALSGIRDGIYEIFPDMTISSSLYIVGENDIRTDPNVNFPNESQAMYDLSEEPKQIIIVEGSSSHGTNLLTSMEVVDTIIDWIDNYLQ